jgi:hypothetical protein
METEEKPPPMPAVFQAREGPAAGQVFRSPVSGERPSRFGPRHWFQSAFSTGKRAEIASRMKAYFTTGPP